MENKNADYPCAEGAYEEIFLFLCHTNASHWLDNIVSRVFHLRPVATRKIIFLTRQRFSKFVDDFYQSQDKKPPVSSRSINTQIDELR